jgi:hypothetical protein
LFGSAVPIVIYVVVGKIFGRTVAITAAILTACSYAQVTWSIQARGYMLQQILTLTTIYVVGYLLSDGGRRLWVWCFLSAVLILGLMNQFMYILIIPGVVAIIMQNSQVRERIWRLRFGLLVVLFLGVTYLVLSGFVSSFINYITSSLFPANNLWYYHSFLWRENTLLVFLGMVGLFLFLKTQRSIGAIILVHLFLHLFFVSFGYAHYNTKYLLPVYPYFFIGMALALRLLVHMFTRNKAWITFMTILLAVLIIANGDTFAARPKKYYNLNHIFREVSNIDYSTVYAPIKEAVATKPHEVVVVETWLSRPYWYLGIDFPNVALFRWQNEDGITNGHLKKTDIIVRSDGSKVLSKHPEIMFVGEESDLRRLVEKYPRGFIFIDDTSLPADVISYAEKNLKKEVYLDRYPQDDNPYSIWPATLYSWGDEKK